MHRVGSVDGRRGRRGARKSHAAREWSGSRGEGENRYKEGEGQESGHSCGHRSTTARQEQPPQPRTFLGAAIKVSGSLKGHNRPSRKPFSRVRPCPPRASTIVPVPLDFLVFVVLFVLTLALLLANYVFY